MMNPQDDTIARGPDNLFLVIFPITFYILLSGEYTHSDGEYRWLWERWPGAGDGYCLGVATVVTTIGDPGTWPACDCAFSLILSCVA